MSHFTLFPVARDDVVEIVNRIGERNRRAALRVYDAIHASFRLLAENPRAGTSCEIEDADLADLRFWPVKKYKNYLVVYRQALQGIEVVRVFHGARDMYRILRRPHS